jgi:hypothetical protein
VPLPLADTSTKLCGRAPELVALMVAYRIIQLIAFNRDTVTVHSIVLTARVSLPHPSVTHVRQDVGALFRTKDAARYDPATLTAR